MRTIETCRLLGGRPCLDFVNTVDARRDRWGPDFIERYEDLLIWCERLSVLTQGELASARAAATSRPHEADMALVRATEFREALYEVLTATAEGRPFPEKAVEVFLAEVGGTRRCRTFVQSGHGFSWGWADERPLDRPLHRIALDAATLLMDEGQLGRLKECFGPNCGWLFIDTTRNRTRRWCSEETCGTRSRVLRHRARKQGHDPRPASPVAKDGV